MAGMNNPPGTPRDDGEMAGNFLNPFQSESVSPHHTAILLRSPVTTCTLQIYLRSLYAIVSLNIGSWYNINGRYYLIFSLLVPLPLFSLQYSPNMTMSVWFFFFILFLFYFFNPSPIPLPVLLVSAAFGMLLFFFRLIINSPQLPQTCWAGAVAPFSRLTWPRSEGRPVQSRKKAGIGPFDGLNLPAGLRHWIGTLRAPEWTTVFVHVRVCVWDCTRKTLHN